MDLFQQYRLLGIRVIYKAMKIDCVLYISCCNMIVFKALSSPGNLCQVPKISALSRWPRNFTRQSMSLWLNTVYKQSKIRYFVLVYLYYFRMDACVANDKVLEQTELQEEHRASVKGVFYICWFVKNVSVIHVIRREDIFRKETLFCKRRKLFPMPRNIHKTINDIA